MTTFLHIHVLETAPTNDSFAAALWAGAGVAFPICAIRPWEAWEHRSVLVVRLGPEEASHHPQHTEQLVLYGNGLSGHGARKGWKGAVSPGRLSHSSDLDAGCWRSRSVDVPMEATAVPAFSRCVDGEAIDSARGRSDTRLITPTTSPPVPPHVHQPPLARSWTGLPRCAKNNTNMQVLMQHRPKRFTIFDALPQCLGGSVGREEWLGALCQRLFRLRKACETS